jgi:hypothetical protein
MTRFMGMLALARGELAGSIRSRPCGTTDEGRDRRAGPSHRDAVVLE